MARPASSRCRPLRLATVAENASPRDSSLPTASSIRAAVSGSNQPPKERMRRGFIASDTSANSPSTRGSVSARSQTTTICASPARKCLTRSSSARVRSSSTGELALAAAHDGAASRRHRDATPSASEEDERRQHDRRELGVEHVERRPPAPGSTPRNRRQSRRAKASDRDHRRVKRPNAAVEIAKPRAPSRSAKRRAPPGARSDARSALSADDANQTPPDLRKAGEKVVNHVSNQCASPKCDNRHLYL